MSDETTEPEIDTASPELNVASDSLELEDDSSSPEQILAAIAAEIAQEQRDRKESAKREESLEDSEGCLEEGQQLDQHGAKSEESHQSVSAESENEVRFLPAVQFYQRSYANSCANNDRKALKIYKEFESAEKKRKLNAELNALAQGRVPEQICAQICGPTRKGRYGSYERWAKMMLGMLNSPGV